MKFKLDENLPVETAGDLRQLGHDAATVIEEDLSGAEDLTVVAAANAEGRVLLTLDKGIANIRKYRFEELSGIVLFRPDSPGRKEVLSFVRSYLAEDFVAGSRRTPRNSRPHPNPNQVSQRFFLRFREEASR